MLTDADFDRLQQEIIEWDECNDSITPASKEEVRSIEDEYTKHKVNLYIGNGEAETEFREALDEMFKQIKDNRRYPTV